MKRKIIFPIIALLLALVFGGGAALGVALAARAEAVVLQNTFSYQGFLEDGSGPITDTCDLEFKLWDDPTAGSQIPPTVTKTGIPITDGLFSVHLNFGPAAFDGEDRYLEIGVKCTGDISFTTLGPRQPITPVPYALFAMDTTPLENVITVAGSGGDFWTIQAAIDHAVAQGAGPGNRFLVYVAPGFYYEQVTMAPYVDLQGSGINMTKLTWHGSDTPDEGTLMGAEYSQVRHIFIANEGEYPYAIGVYNEAVTQASYLHVEVQSWGGPSGTYAFLNNGAAGECHVRLEHINTGTRHSPIQRTIYFQQGAYGDIAHAGVYAQSEDPSADMIGIGLTQMGSDTWINSLEIGAYANGAGSSAKGIWLGDNNRNLYINGLHSDADGTASGDGIYLENSGIIMANVKTSGDAANGTATGIRSISSWLQAMSSEVFANGNLGYGVYITEGGARFWDVMIQTDTNGSGEAQGLHNEGSSNIQIADSTITVSCPDCTATAIWNQGGNLSMDGGRAVAYSTTGSTYGMQFDGANADLFDANTGGSGPTTFGITAIDSSGSCRLKIHNSAIGFVTTAVDISGSSTNVYIANSMLAGSILTDGSATYHCIQNYDGPFNSVTCP